ncbi:cAMP-responsive element modulator isoform X18 [Phascolarctos cinereus]|uniref:cAMP-responsive element modulator isoform X17 n=1 Tax=Phascolarctos cinereus TaxID=38626 RepID=A0A6P5KK89_PHACI|nr:cAMP-responsive element modulator isoform X17 [Phascolarctos cinereus]
MFQASHTGGLLFRGSRKKGFCSWIRYRKRLSSCNSSAVAFRSNCTCPGSDSDTTAIGYPVTTDTNCSAATGDMPTYQIRTPTTALPQGVVMAASPGSLHSPQQLAEEATRKRELRLMKNREAARECRRKKKEYVKCLENRVAVLENQNKTLIEELKALKDLYCHKAE